MFEIAWKFKFIKKVFMHQNTLYGIFNSGKQIVANTTTKDFVLLTKKL